MLCGFYAEGKKLKAILCDYSLRAGKEARPKREFESTLRGKGE
jgi:hypothetical protein